MALKNEIVFHVVMCTILGSCLWMGLDSRNHPDNYFFYTPQKSSDSPHMYIIRTGDNYFNTQLIFVPEEDLGKHWGYNDKWLLHSPSQWQMLIGDYYFNTLFWLTQAYILAFFWYNWPKIKAYIKEWLAETNKHVKILNDDGQEKN